MMTSLRLPRLCLRSATALRGGRVGDSRRRRSRLGREPHQRPDGTEERERGANKDEDHLPPLHADRLLDDLYLRGTSRRTSTHDSRYASTRGFATPPDAGAAALPVGSTGLHMPCCSRMAFSRRRTKDRGNTPAKWSPTVDSLPANAPPELLMRRRGRLLGEHGTQPRCLPPLPREMSQEPSLPGISRGVFGSLRRHPGWQSCAQGAPFFSASWPSRPRACRVEAHPAPLDTANNLQ